MNLFNLLNGRARGSRESYPINSKDRVWLIGCLTWDTVVRAFLQSQTNGWGASMSVRLAAKERFAQSLAAFGTNALVAATFVIPPRLSVAVSHSPTDPGAGQIPVSRCDRTRDPDNHV
jgi:hypothetical protein